MEKDEITVETQDEIQESQTPVEGDTTEETSETITETVESTETAPKEVKISPAEYRHFKKWEKTSKENTQPASSQPSVEETVLLAQGVPEELVEELKLRASKYGGSLIKAQKDSNYIAVKENFEKEQKQKSASLPASRGSGSVKPKVDFTTPGLSREDHKKMVMGS